MTLQFEPIFIHRYIVLSHLFFSSPPFHLQALHLVVIPMTTAFYNIFAMVGIFPELEQQVERFKIQHHLRYRILSILTYLSLYGILLSFCLVFSLYELCSGSLLIQTFE